MNTYSVSHLAQNAGVSVHVVRDYLLRGLLQPAVHTAGGHRLFDAQALQRLCFVREAFEAGVSLEHLARLCRALDAPHGGKAVARLAELRQLLKERQKTLTGLEVQLNIIEDAIARHNEA